MHLKCGPFLNAISKVIQKYKLANFLCKVPEKIFALNGSFDFCYTYLTLLPCERNHRQYVREWEWLCSNHQCCDHRLLTPFLKRQCSVLYLIGWLEFSDHF